VFGKPGGEHPPIQEQPTTEVPPEEPTTEVPPEEPTTEVPPGDDSPFTDCSSGVVVLATNIQLEQQVIDRINAARAAEGLPAFTIAPELTNAARYHTADMGVDNYTDIVSRDRINGELVEACQPRERFSAYYNAKSWRSLIGWDYTDPLVMVDEFLEMADYREVMMSTTMTEIGVGYYTGNGDDAPYWEILIAIPDGTHPPIQEPTTEVPPEEPTTEVPPEEPTTEVPPEEPTSNVHFTGCSTGVVVPVINANLEEQVIALTNQERIAEGLSPLTIAPELMNAARYHATDMGVDDYTSHPSQDRVNGNLEEVCPTNERLSAYYTYQVMAENIAWGYSDPQQLVDAWMNSPTHRENILNPDVTEIGVGYYEGSGEFGRYWTQVFGAPGGEHPPIQEPLSEIPTEVPTNPDQPGADMDNVLYLPLLTM
jgi:uncharacterized protein YkwD